MADYEAGAGLDPFQVAVARSDMAQVSAARQAASGDGMSNLEAARLIARVLEQAAERLGIPYRFNDFADGGVGLDEFLGLILARAREGGLDPLAYRIAWTLAHVPSSNSSPFILTPRFLLPLSPRRAG